MKKFMTVLATLVATGCASVPRGSKVILDKSVENTPSWVKDTKTSWVGENAIYFRSTYIVRGDQRVNACFDMAELDAKEKLLTEMATDLVGRIDNAVEDTSEVAEIVLSRIRSSQFEGRIQGLRFTDRYHERYVVDNIERVDCHTVSEISKADFARLKAAIVHGVIDVDPKLKEAIRAKHVEIVSRGAGPAIKPEGE